MNIPFTSNKIIKNKKEIIYNKIGNNYHKTRAPDPRIVNKIVDLIGPCNLKNIIDLGAGTGNYSFELAKKGFIVTAIEPSEVMISQSKKHINLKYIKSFAESLPFDIEQFDVAITTLALHLFKNLKTSILEMFRVLNINGKAIFFTFDNRIIDKKFWMRKYFKDNIIEAEQSMPKKEEMVSLMEEIGFKNVSTHNFPLPENLIDGFLFSAWKEPRKYLDVNFLKGISLFAKNNLNSYKEQLELLEMEIDNGLWNKNYGDILNQEYFDAGYYFICGEKNI